jgi:hypothetical protein
MFNFNVHPAQQQERLNICKKCKFYNDGWCGTPLIGGTVEPEENNVTYYKEKIKLCGCWMPSCPAHKWHALNWSKREIAQLDTFIGKVKDATKIEQSDVNELYAWYSKITKQVQKPSQCPSCIRDLIKEFRRQLGKQTETL